MTKNVRLLVGIIVMGTVILLLPWPYFMVGPFLGWPVGLWAARGK